jgi:hypothetical protein
MARPHRQPLTDLPAHLAKVAQQAEELRELEEQAADVRVRLHKAMRVAHAAGASFALIARIAGVSRQAVSQVFKGQ